MRALRRLGLPTLIFVNKIDRAGADDAAGSSTRSANGWGSTPSRWTAPATSARRAAAVAATRTTPTVADAAHRDPAGTTTTILRRYLDGEPRADDRAARRRYAAQTAARLRPPGLLRLRDDRRRRRRALTGHRRPAARAAATPSGPPPARSSRSSARPSGEKLALVRMFSGRCDARPVATSARRPMTASPPSACSSTGRPRRRRSTHGRRDREVCGSGRDASATASARPAGRSPRHAFPPPTLERGRRARDPRDQARAVRRADRAGRAGPAHQPATGRRAPELSLSLYGEVPEGGHRRLPRERLLLAGHLPRDHADLRGAATRRRRGRGVPERADEPVRRDPGPARRARPRLAPASSSGSTWTSARCRCTSTRPRATSPR